MPPLTTRGFSVRRTPSAGIATLVSLTKLARLVPEALSKRDQFQSPYGAYNAGLSAEYGYGTFAKEPEAPETPPGSPDFVWKLVLSVGLVLLGGVFAGYVAFLRVDIGWLRVRTELIYSLTLALMGSDDLNLRVLATSSDDPKERQSAAKVMRLLARGRHWVLVVLLLSNVVSQLALSCRRMPDQLTLRSLTNPSQSFSTPSSAAVSQPSSYRPP